MLDFSHYRFTLRAQTSIGFVNNDIGTTLRGAFGTALRHIVCIDRQQSCMKCPVRPECVYATVFNPAKDPDSGPKRQQTPPRGFVIKPPLDPKTLYPPGATIIFDFLLVGRLQNYLPYVIVPFTELGRLGIGRGRGKFSLAAIDAVTGDNSVVQVYRETDGIVHNASATINTDALIRSDPLPADVKVTLRFLTPTRIRFNPTGERGKSRPVRTPAFFHIACRLRDRISALCREYGPAPLEIDFKGFGLRAREIRTVESKVKWVEEMRKSRMQHRHDLSGFTGEVTFQGDLREFWPFLVLGQYVHVGDNAVFGRGWYAIEKAR